MTSPLFEPALKLGRLARPFLPRGAARTRCRPGRARRAHRWPTRTHPRKVLMLMGCVQPAMMPNINSATARVLDACGIQTLVADDAGCCGALRTHLADREGGLNDMRRNIDAWWPLVEGLTDAGRVEAIVMNASGCGVMVKEYGHALAHDPAYADKARRIARADQGPERAAARARAAAEAARCAWRTAGAPGLPPAVHAAARPAAARQRRGGIAANSASRSSRRRKATCAAARPAPIRCCSPNWRTHCATASWRTSTRCSRARSCRPTSAASSTCSRAPPRRCAIGSRCWTRRCRVRPAPCAARSTAPPLRTRTCSLTTGIASKPVKLAVATSPSCKRRTASRSRHLRGAGEPRGLERAARDSRARRPSAGMRPRTSQCPCARCRCVRARSAASSRCGARSVGLADDSRLNTQVSLTRTLHGSASARTMPACAAVCERRNCGDVATLSMNTAASRCHARPGAPAPRGSEPSRVSASRSGAVAPK